MASLLSATQRAEIIARLRHVTPDHQRLWGTMSAPAMLCHVSDQLRVALGDLPSQPRGNRITRTLVKWLAVDVQIRPPRGKIRTVPEMLTSRPTEWSRDRAACEQLIERVGRGEANAVHPAFGPLSRGEWGRLCWSHLDHHLRQFGS
jgi:uncharacterized protein DUF1569